MLCTRFHSDSVRSHKYDFIATNDYINSTSPTNNTLLMVSNLISQPAYGVKPNLYSIIENSIIMKFQLVKFGIQILDTIVDKIVIIDMHETCHAENNHSDIDIILFTFRFYTIFFTLIFTLFSLFFTFYHFFHIFSLFSHFYTFFNTPLL